MSGLCVWFPDDITRAVHALRLAAEACQDMPAYYLKDQEAAYRAGFAAGFDAALLAVAAAFGVDGREVVHGILSIKE